MNEIEAARGIAEALESLSVPYMLVGSLSSSAYGIVRSTQDADFVVELGQTPVSQIVARLGARYKLDPQMSFETVTGTSRFWIYRVESGFKIELFLLSSDPHDQERFRRRVQRPALGTTFWLPTPEDVIITKLRWSKAGKRVKDVEDVRNVLAVQGDSLEWEYIHRWCDAHGTRQLLDRTQASIPPRPASQS